MRLHGCPVGRIQEAEEMVAVLGRTVSDFASRSFRTESVQRAPPVVICIGIGQDIRYSSRLLSLLGSGGHPIVGITAQLADSLDLLGCPPHPTQSVGPGLPHRTGHSDAVSRPRRLLTESTTADGIGAMGPTLRRRAGPRWKADTLTKPGLTDPTYRPSPSRSSRSRPV